MGVVHQNRRIRSRRGRVTRTARAGRQARAARRVQADRRVGADRTAGADRQARADRRVQADRHAGTGQRFFDKTGWSIVTATSALFLFLLTGLLLSGCTSQPPEPTLAQETLLGTVLRIQAYGEAATDDLMVDVFDRIAEIEARMSTSVQDYDTTELLEVNRAAGENTVTVSADTFHVVERAAHFSRLTDGAFDVTIWPLVRLWGIGTEDAQVPTEEELAEARNLVDYQQLRLAPPDSVYLPRPGMGVDVGAIAKGYAADQAADILKTAGVEHALLDFGGNILVIGNKPNGQPWRIGVQQPDGQRSTYLGILEAQDTTIVTSGPYERYFEQDGRRYHHILNSETGYPAESGLTQVTIVSGESMTADALSTACYVMGLERSMNLVNSLDDVEAIFVTEYREVYLTEGLRSDFSITEESYRLAN